MTEHPNTESLTPITRTYRGVPILWDGNGVYAYGRSSASWFRLLTIGAVESAMLTGSDVRYLCDVDTVLVDNVGQPLNPLTFLFDTSEFEGTHGRRPRGRGFWVFQFGGRRQIEAVGSYTTARRDVERSLRTIAQVEHWTVHPIIVKVLP